MTTREKKLVAMTKAELRKHKPKTQEECCALAARVSIACSGAPTTDQQFCAAAWGVAAGLFGPAFDRASEGQKWDWIDMCERALRAAA